ncbi:MAG: transporter substrate-binding domain-containing protein [Epibacterium sp.]|nr:transporter substrate-binding domain-containing protein [Epibacterium sp.]NQX72153.1 transporter substrate-binding domain-containing protein [Epibacterium sp.]
MKTFTIRLAAALTIASLFFGSTAQADPIVITSGEYPPFTGEALPEGGLVNGLVTEIAKKAGVEFTFEYLPWKRALALTQQGQKAASSYWAERSDQTGLTMVGPVQVGETVLFYRKDKPIPEFASAEEIKDIRIGATLGYGYFPGFWENGENGTYVIQTAKDDISNFRKLKAGRIDAFVIDRIVGWTLVQENFTAEDRAVFAASETALAESYGYLQVSTQAEGGSELAQKLQAAFDAMKASGALEAKKAELSALMGLADY